MHCATELDPCLNYTQITFKVCFLLKNHSPLQLSLPYQMIFVNSLAVDNNDYYYYCIIRVVNHYEGTGVNFLNQ